jgi:hypothetical protein
MASKEVHPGRIMQTAFVVADLEAGIQTFSRQLNIGGWALKENVSFSDILYRGAPSDLKLRSATAYQGEMMYELIQQINDVPSVYRELTDRTGYGFHHFAIIVADVADEIAHYNARGFSIAMDVRVAKSGVRAVYIDCTEQTHGMVELLQDTPITRAWMEATAVLESELEAGGPRITKL